MPLIILLRGDDHNEVCAGVWRCGVAPNCYIVSMTPRFASALLVASVLLLAACTPISAAEPNPAVPETPTPTQTASAEPQSTLPLECDDLFSDAAASAAVGQPVQSVDPASLVNNITSIEALQGGLLQCAWDPAGKWDWHHALSIRVLGDAEQDYAGRTTGDDQQGCYSVDAFASYCLTDALVGGYWVQLVSRSVGTDGGRTQELADPAWASAVEAVTTAVSAAGAPRDPWVAPSGAFTGAICDGLGDPQVWPITNLVEAAASRTPTESCVTADGWRIDIVPGGAWALPGMAETLPPANYEVGSWQPLDGTGSDVALWACGDGCYAIASVGGSAVSVTGPISVPEEFVPAASLLLQQVIAAG
jgi:hypothetical protein